MTEIVLDDNKNNKNNKNNKSKKILNSNFDLEERALKLINAMDEHASKDNCQCCAKVLKENLKSK